MPPSTPRAQDAYPVNPSPLRKTLWALGKLLPGNYLKTMFYLNAIEKPRRYLRLSLSTFYRMDHIYRVLQEFRDDYSGRFSVLEFGTSDGYSFTKMLYATRYLGMEDRVTVHAFDSFEGMPAPRDEKDIDLVSGDSFVEGEFRGHHDALEAYCAQHYRNYRIHKGYFEETLTDEFLVTLRDELPILVWFDCDYYSSARTVWERIMNYLPNGCVLYFDELESINYGSRFTGEARLVHEINQGRFGDDIELVPDPKLSLDSPRIYRFVRCKPDVQYERVSSDHFASAVHRRGDDSPLP